MSTSCEAFIGYTVTLKHGLSGDDFEFFDDFICKHKEYDLYNCKGTVRLVTDGMNGGYARLVFVDEFIKECWVEGNDYFKLRQSPVPENIYEELNKAYKILYDKDLEVSQVEYALWYQFV